jgi:uncharacterized repeat protein (TIGR03803 family)
MTLGKIRSSLSWAAAVSMVTLSLMTTGWAESGEKVLHAFRGTPAKYPDSSLALDAAGNLYGTTAESDSTTCTGGQGGCGVVFELTPTSTGWSYTELYAFKGGQDGSDPTYSLILDAAGNIYGTTLSGGGSQICSVGCGTVFELTPNSTGGWTENVLYRFQGGNDGRNPIGGVVLDEAGNLYGPTEMGGEGCGSVGCGTVFELSPSSGGGWTEQVLYVFPSYGNSDGFNPEGGVTIDAFGNLYGTTNNGGTGCHGAGCGTVFELAPNSTGGWTESVLHRFQGGRDGQFSSGSVVFDQSGNLYGTTFRGGSKAGCGTVFELTPSSGGKWTEGILHRFGCGRDGGGPQTGVTLDAAGNLYGTTQANGTGGDGTVFKLAPVSGGQWAFSVLHSFTGKRDGALPQAGLILDPTDSHLFGTTIYGGVDGLGVVFEVMP